MHDANFQMFKYAKTYIPEHMDKLTEKVPSPSEKNFQKRFM